MISLVWPKNQNFLYFLFINYLFIEFKLCFELKFLISNKEFFYQLNQLNIFFSLIEICFKLILFYKIVLFFFGSIKLIYSGLFKILSN